MLLRLRATGSRRFRGGSREGHRARGAENRSATGSGPTHTGRGRPTPRHRAHQLPADRAGSAEHHHPNNGEDSGRHWGEHRGVLRATLGAARAAGSPCSLRMRRGNPGAPRGARTRSEGLAAEPAPSRRSRLLLPHAAARPPRPAATHPALRRPTAPSSQALPRPRRCAAAGRCRGRCGSRGGRWRRGRLRAIRGSR